MPEQYILAWVDEIIMGPQVRAALGCCPRPRPPPVPHPVATRAWQAGEHRTMGEEGRGNKLPTSDMHSEYMVHGSTASSCGRRATRTASSTYTYWVSLAKMLKDVGQEAVETDMHITRPRPRHPSSRSSWSSSRTTRATATRATARAAAADLDVSQSWDITGFISQEIVGYTLRKSLSSESPLRKQVRVFSLFPYS